MNRNKFGLSRHIPTSVALEVRQRSKFGCVICRCAIYQYEHILPQFSDATSHDAENICLLCGGCHDRVTRGRLSKETVQKKYQLIQSTPDVKRPFEELDLSAPVLSITLGDATFHQTNILLRINGESLLSITPPIDGASFPTLNGVFYDRLGLESLRITDNVWEGKNDAWDITVIGSVVTVTDHSGRIALRFGLSPPGHVTITHLDMYKDNCHIMCTKGELLVGQINAIGATYLGLGGFECHCAEAGICVDSRSGDPIQLTGIRIPGGEGILLDGTGIRIGVGAGQMWIENLKVWHRIVD